jgi:hypothetical protein
MGNLGFQNLVAEIMVVFVSLHLFVILEEGFFVILAYFVANNCIALVP